MTQGSVAQSQPSHARGAAIELGILVAFFLACSVAEPVLDPILRRGSGLAGVLSLAGYQFACEGVELVAILALRREQLSSYAFTRRSLGRSLALALVLACIYDLGLSCHAGALLWIPLRRHTATRMLSATGLPTRFVGLAITITVWGCAIAVIPALTGNAWGRVLVQTMTDAVGSL